MKRGTFVRLALKWGFVLGFALNTAYAVEAYAEGLMPWVYWNGLIAVGLVVFFWRHREAIRRGLETYD